MSDWIAFPGRKPRKMRDQKKFTPVLFCLHESAAKNRVCAGRYYHGKGLFESLQGEFYTWDNVVGWMPMPKPMTRSEAMR